MTLISLFLIAFFGQAYAAQLATVSFELQMPPHMRQIQNVYISGSEASLGSWSPDKMKMKSIGNGRWLFTAQVRAGIPVEYKFTLGDWNHIEVTNDNKNIANHRIQCQSACNTMVQAENFRVEPFHPRPRTAQGNIEYYHEVYFSDLANYRTIAVYLPPGYKTNSYRYPVIYTLDGNNVFDEATASFGVEWKLDEVFENLIRTRKFPPAIVVAIYGTKKRAEEYLMNPRYLDFISRQIKPEIDRRYQTNPSRENTFILGSSYGGVFSFYAAWNASTVFSRIAALSTAYSWNNFAIENMIRYSRPTIKPVRIWMDMGDNEGDNFKPVYLENAYQALLQSGILNETIRKEVIPGGVHSEKSWSQRVARVLAFLLEKKN